MSTLKQLRKVRNKAYRLSIILGDVIAILNGTYIKRVMRKHALKRAGRATMWGIPVSKLKGKRRKRR